MHSARLPANVELHKLHGGIEPSAQRKALAAPPPGKRKLVLASSIAETSVTLEDVRIVVDSGLARRPRYDRGAGLTRLVTERASRAAVTQRAGRAARQAPGVAIRLWEEAATASLPGAGPARNLRSRSVEPAADLLCCGAKPTRAAFPFSTRRPPRRSRKRASVSRAWRDRPARTPHRPWSRDCRAAARAAARAHADRRRERADWLRQLPMLPSCSPSAALAATTSIWSCAGAAGARQVVTRRGRAQAGCELAPAPEGRPGRF